MLHVRDRRLVRRLLRKEPRAFEEFFSANFGHLFRFCATRIPYPDQCEDIVQETLVKAVTKLHTYRGEAALFTWLCGICRNEIADWYRSPHARRLRTGGLRPMDDDQSLADPEAGDADESQAMREVVRLALDQLPIRYALALEWKYIHGYSVAEIGMRLGLGTTATQSLLARARRRFRELWTDLAEG